ncbi:hypothetical protein [Beijerinckia mobilis]|uniref:hypothetical protein n=1 Tax=Beijerinckia mobilis TaxID=231434 RepID=UPI001FDA2CB6|nr:hypothetical protein [Beijerinckia mobilis]
MSLDRMQHAMTAPSPLMEAEKAKSSGIAIVANDKVMHWLLAFLESWQATNATLPIYLIPYDDNMSMTRKVAELYGVTIVDVDNKELDALAKRLYPWGIVKRNRLRKLLSLAIPLDEVIHLDADIILFRDLRDVLGLLDPGKTDFLVIERTHEYVYNKHQNEYDYLRDVTLFNDGFFVTSNKILTIQDFYDAMQQDENVFHRVRQRGGLYAQPLTNFVTHRKRLKIIPVHERVEGVSGESYHEAKNVTFDQNGLPLDEWGRKIYFCHWAGVTGNPKGGVFDGLWKHYSDKAALRIKEAKLV